MGATISAVVLEADDVARAQDFYATLGLSDRVMVRAGEGPTSGFRGYSLSLVVSRPDTVDAFLTTAVDAGATVVKPASKSFWGYGGVVQAPDGAIWTVASSKKAASKDGGAATLAYDDLVLLLGVSNVKATKQFYVDQGLEVGRSYGSKYVELATSGITLALQSRRAVAKNAGVDPAGTGVHRIAVVGDAGAFTDPDGFVWETAPAVPASPSDPPGTWG